MNIGDQKAAARKAAFARRASADQSATGAANRHLEAAVRELPGHTVSAYWPMRTEIDPRPAMRRLSETHELCLPVVLGKGRPLAFRQWGPGTEMAEGAFGAFVPAKDVPMSPEILIVPLAAFDTAGYRLGYGGGFYDRTLEKLRSGGQVTAIGFAFDVQESDQVPREPTDQRLDLIVTQTGLRILS